MRPTQKRVNEFVEGALKFSQKDLGLLEGMVILHFLIEGKLASKMVKEALKSPNKEVPVNDTQKV